MPSHPDRVRRNYYEIKVTELNDIQNNQQQIVIGITKAAIASKMSSREIKMEIFRLINKGITEQYK